mmetsp:Transcript_61517/g.133122  ORF Transcript_61517/g.133122 Transcript_61517/m.133122 type:complete len:430 (+) Transcript_61517:56-1345(+)
MHGPVALEWPLGQCHELRSGDSLDFEGLRDAIHGLIVIFWHDSYGSPVPIEDDADLAVARSLCKGMLRLRLGLRMGQPLTRSPAESAESGATEATCAEVRECDSVEGNSNTGDSVASIGGQAVAGSVCTDEGKETPDPEALAWAVQVAAALTNLVRPSAPSPWQWQHPRQPSRWMFGLPRAPTSGLPSGLLASSTGLSNIAAAVPVPGGDCVDEPQAEGSECGCQEEDLPQPAIHQRCSSSRQHREKAQTTDEGDAPLSQRQLRTHSRQIFEAGKPLFASSPEWCSPKGQVRNSRVEEAKADHLASGDTAGGGTSSVDSRDVAKDGLPGPGRRHSPSRMLFAPLLRRASKPTEKTEKDTASTELSAALDAFRHPSKEAQSTLRPEGARSQSREWPPGKINWSQREHRTANSRRKEIFSETFAPGVPLLV